MTKGKPWTAADEQRLRDLVKGSMNAMEIAEVMDKTFQSVRTKIWNLGLSQKEQAHAKRTACASSLKLSQDLPSLEEKLKVMNAALVALEQPGLSRNEILRLRNLIQCVKDYRVEFEKYVGYRELEVEVLELARKVEESKGEVLELRRKLEESKLEVLELRKKFEASTAQSASKSSSDTPSA